MTQRRPLRAAQSLNAAADQSASESWTQPTVEEKRATRELIGQIREALIEARLFGSIIPEYGQTYSKLTCPQKNDDATPRTLIVAEANGVLKVRHPYDGASDTIRPMLSYRPSDYQGRDIGKFVIGAIKELHGAGPKPSRDNAPVMKF